MKRNLILGLASHYKWTQLKTFVCSLRSTSYQDDVVLFITSELDEETREKLEEKSIHYIYLDEEISNKKVPLSLSRISVYLSFLEMYLDRYENVMLSDTRDVVFQKNPFSFNFGTSLCFFMEPGTTLIKDEEWNSMWLISALGMKVFHRISHHSISCFGTTIGPVSKIMEYLKLINRYSTQIKIMIWGIEQGIHNYIVQSRLIDNTSIFTAEEGPILTIGAGYTKEITQNSDGFFLNERREVIHVIHQYDRHPVLNSYWEDKYR